MIKFVEDDGGRKAAGFKGSANDCATRAIAIASGLPYREVYDGINEIAKRERSRKSSARSGVTARTMRRYLDEVLGWEWIPTMKIGSGCRVHLRADELPGGRIIVSLSGHYAAVVDGVLHDTFDDSRDGTRCVYGYWQEGG